MLADPEPRPDAALYRPCAGIMLVNSANLVFVGQRFDSRYNAWQMPQGGIDDGEDAEIGALREIEEETGIRPHLVQVIARSAGEHYYDLPDELQKSFWGGRFLGQRQTWFLMRFLGQDADVNIATDIPEFCEWKWTPHDRLVDLIVPFKKALYQAVVDEFSGYFIK